MRDLKVFSNGADLVLSRDNNEKKLMPRWLATICLLWTVWKEHRLEGKQNKAL